MESQLERNVEHFCQWVFSAFIDVDNREEMKRVLDYLEQANQAAEAGNRGYALGYIATAIERVFGCNSTEYREFLRLYFPNQLAWKEHLEESNARWDDPMTQQEAIATMAKVNRRTMELASSKV